MGLFKKVKKEKVKPNKKARQKTANKEQTEEIISLDTDRENIFLKNTKSIKDLIAPDHIDFTTDPKYFSVGDKYLAKSLYIGLMPNAVNFASFLHSLYNYGNIDTSIFISPVDNETAKADLSTARTNLEMEYLTSGGSNNRADDMSAKVAEAARLREEVRDGLNKIFEVSIQSTLYERDLRSLNNNTDQLKETLGQQDIGLKSAIYAQEEGFKSNKPMNMNWLGEWHTFDKRSLACVFPFTIANINHENGVLFGFNMDNGLPVFYDTFDNSLNNYNMVIFARSGGGKSTTIKMLAARSSTLDSVQNIAIDIEPEYREIAETLGGINITIAPGTDTIINPFDVVPDLEINNVTGKEEEIVNLSEKINSVTAILMTMAKGQLSNNAFYDDISRMIIKEIVSLEYKRVGITKEVESLYEFREDRIIDGKMVGGRFKKEMPTITSWYRSLLKQAKANENITYQPYYDYLTKIMVDYSAEYDGGFTCFDGQNNVDLNYDIPFINFDISQLNENQELPLAQHIITDFIWEKMVKRNNTGHKIRVLIDEAWKMINYPEALQFLITMFRRARKKNTSAVVISQQFDEFYSDQTKPIIQNSETKLFLPPDPTSIDDIKEVFKLTDGEREFLRSSQRGEGLLIVNNQSAKVRIEIPEVEIDFIETNQNVMETREMKEGA